MDRPDNLITGPGDSTSYPPPGYSQDLRMEPFDGFPCMDQDASGCLRILFDEVQ